MDTATRVKVRIDLNRVAQNLRTADGRGASEATARSFLKEAGFVAEGDGTWLGTKSSLLRLNHSEVIGIDP